VIKSLAKKVTSKTDKRLVDVSISDKGRKLLHKLDEFEVDIEKLLQNLSVTEAKTLNNLLDKIRRP
jgi:DNA-binding MarR family transcriptional regulator